MRTKKILALLLAAVMLVGALVSCGSAYDEPTKYIELPELGKVTIKYDDLKEAVDDAIEEILTGAKDQVFEKVEDKEATVKKGDQLLINYTFKNADKTLPDAVVQTLTGTDYYLTIGKDDSKFPIDYTNKNNASTDDDKDEDGKAADTKVIVTGLENQLIGHKVGEKIEITAQFPNDHSNADLKNVKVTYEIEIQSIARISIDEDFTVTFSYTVTDKKEDVEDILVAEITTTPAPVTTSTPVTSSENPTTTSAPESTTAAVSTTAPESTTKPTFADLFPAGTSTSYDFTSTTDKEKTIAKIFKLTDFIRYFEGHTIYDKFAVPITVPADADSKYADYLGKEIYVTISIDSTKSVPEWTDYFVNKYTNKEYTTAKAYKDEITKQQKQTLAYDTVLEQAKVKEWPYDEWEMAYENYVEVHLIEFIKAAEGKKENESVYLSDYTPAELKEIVKDKDYEAIQLKATYSAREAVKGRLVMEALFNELGITLSRSEYKEKMAEIEEEYNTNAWYYMYVMGVYDFDAYVNYFGGKEYFELQFKNEMLLEKLIEKVVFEEEPTDAK